MANIEQGSSAHVAAETTGLYDPVNDWEIYNSLGDLIAYENAVNNAGWSVTGIGDPGQGATAHVPPDAELGDYELHLGHSNLIRNIDVGFFTVVPFAGWVQVGIIPEGGCLCATATGLMDWGLGICNAGGNPDEDAVPDEDFPAFPLLINRYGAILALVPLGEDPDDYLTEQLTENVVGFPATEPVTLNSVHVCFTNAELLAACSEDNQGPWTVWTKANDEDLTNNTGQWAIELSADCNNTMARFIFSTGEYRVSLPLPLPVVTRQVKGTPSAAAQPLGNLTDASVETVVDLPITDGNNFRYLRLDYGTSQTFGRVNAYKVTLAGGGASLTCYVSNTSITNGDFSGATAVPGTNISGDWEFAPVGGVGTSVAGRYLYLVPATGATSCSIGDVDIRATEYIIGAMQSISLGFLNEVKELRGSTAESLYPLANAIYDQRIEINAEHADLNESAVIQFTGAMLSVVGANNVLTGGTSTKPIPFVGELRALGSDGRKFNVVTYHTYAPGFAWSTKRDDFGSNSFKARCRIPDAVSANVDRPWRIYAQI